MKSSNTMPAPIPESIFFNSAWSTESARIQVILARARCRETAISDSTAPYSSVETKQELNLFQFAAIHMAELSARSAKIV
jgi:hypothetical protein